MRLAAVQVDGDGRDRDVRKRERGHDMAPPGEIEEARKQHFGFSPQVSPSQGALWLI